MGMLQKIGEALTRDPVHRLRQQRDAALLQQETAVLKADANALEISSRLTEAWNDLVNPYDWMADDPSFGRPMHMMGAQRGDRKHGVNIPIFQTEEELTALRAMARHVADISPNAKCALRNLTNYVLGTGCEYSVTTRNDDVRSDLARMVQQVVDDFLDGNKWIGRREREVFRRSRRDGEIFLALYHVGGGRVRTRFVEPEQVTEPDDSRAIEDHIGWDEPSDWKFGIHTHEGDVETVHGYHVQWSDKPADFDYISTSRMVHIKLNVDTNIKRGLSDFHPVYGYLQDSAKLLGNTVKGASVLAAIAAIREHVAGTTVSQVRNLQSDNAHRSYTQPTANQGSRTAYVHKIEPGTFLDVAPGQKYVAGPLANRGVGDACVVINQAVLRVIGTNWCMPEYLISGDASNNNYASAMVAESPWVKNCEAEQGYSTADYADLMWKVVRIAYEAGRFNQFGLTLEQIHDVLEITVEAPRVSTREPEKETGQRQVLSTEGLLSDQTWAAQEGLDLVQEREQGAKRRETPGFGLPGSHGLVGESRQERIKQVADALWEAYP